MHPIPSFLIVLVFALVQLAGSARATVLVLEKGWTNAPFETSPAEAFSDQDRVDLCTAKQGRLWIQPSGVVSV